MDRLSILREEAGASQNSSLDSTSRKNESFVTANESGASKYFSLSEEDSSFNISVPDKYVSIEEATSDQLLSNLSSISKKADDLEGYNKIGKEIKAANILSGGVNIFDNDNSYDGDELVIDDNVYEEKNMGEQVEEKQQDENDILVSKEAEVVLQIDGKNLNAINIGHNLYLYRKEGEDELAAIQIIDDDHQQPNFKFLKVRENSDGNLEVYEEIPIEVPKDLPIKDGVHLDKNISQVSTKDRNKVMCEPTGSKGDIGLMKADDKVDYNDINSNIKVTLNETRKSPLIGGFMAFHSTPNKEGIIPLTKTMVHQQLHFNRPSDTTKKTIEVHTDKKKNDEKPIQIKDDLGTCNTAETSVEKYIKDNICEKPDSDESENKQETPEIKVCDELYVENVTILSLNSSEQMSEVQTTHESKLGINFIKECTRYPENNSSEFEVPKYKVEEVETKKQELTVIEEKHSLIYREIEKDLKTPDFKMEESKQENTQKFIDTSVVDKNMCNESNPKANNIEENSSLVISKTLLDKNEFVEKTKLYNSQVQHDDDNVEMHEQKIKVSSDKELSIENELIITAGTTNTATQSSAKSEMILGEEKTELTTETKESVNQLPSTFKITEKYKDITKITKHESSNNSETILDVKSSSNSNNSTNTQSKDYSEVKPKIINNNKAVPFGKWTEANRQEFLNKYKESKIPVNSSSTNQIRNSNDLNRRDVLKKIDIQRQTSTTMCKSSESSVLQRQIVKNENPVFQSQNKLLTVDDNKIKNELLLSNESISQAPSVEPQHSNEILNVPNKDDPQRNDSMQDLIDKTIEGMLNKIVSTQSTADDGKNVLQGSELKVLEKSSHTSLNDIEFKMNELHGIPFIERLPHELPNTCDRNLQKSSIEIKEPVFKNTNKVPQLLPLSNVDGQKNNKEKLEVDLAEEIIEHEPITGDTDGKNVNLKIDVCEHSKASTSENTETDSIKPNNVITEQDFDKFARRNSVTFENNITVTATEIEKKVDIPVVKPEDIIKTKLERSSFVEGRIKSPQNQPATPTSKSTPDAGNDNKKNYPSKLKMAYNSAITAKRQMGSPITIIEDKPVKVIFMDANLDISSIQLNVTGKELSPEKKVLGTEEASPVSTGDSVDSYTLDSFRGNQIEGKTKSKHQRKQVLKPVDTPDLELIEPYDIGIEVSPIKKRKTEDKTEKKEKNRVPKKSFLLSGQNDNRSADLVANLSVSSTETVSPLDNLVRAAELIENQSENITEQTPTKRGRGRPRKYLSNEASGQKVEKLPTRNKKPRLVIAKYNKFDSSSSDETYDDSVTLRENWTMGKIDENILCPICHKLFRSENVVFKHVKHCSGPSPNRSEEGTRSKTDGVHLETHSDCLDSTEDMIVDQLEIKTVGVKSMKTNEIIVIEDSPLKISTDTKKQHREIYENGTNTKTQYKYDSCVCEFCGKSFRNTSYLLSHKLKHKNKDARTVQSSVENSSMTVFSCDDCKKQFRKLHHLVQHRFIHKPAVSSKPAKKNSDEQKPIAENTSKSNKDLSAGFRCERCDKSFRKLHHLVEHRETHEAVIRHKIVANTHNNVEKPITHQCIECKKTFKKRQQLMEHEETHAETYSETSDDKSIKSCLSTKDIIHECSLCYMVFPNEHSLNKHIYTCKKKKKNAEAKQQKQLNDKNVDHDLNINETKDSREETVIIVTEKENNLVSYLTNEQRDANGTDIKNVETLTENLPEVSIAPYLQSPELSTIQKDTTDLKETRIIDNRQSKSFKPQKKLSGIKKSFYLKEKIEPKITLRKKSSPLIEDVKSSDDEEARYMLNPDFKSVKSVDCKQFMKVVCEKRNSLRFSHPDNRNISKPSIAKQEYKSLRLKPKLARSTNSNISERNIQLETKLEIVPATDSEDSEVRYAFPDFSSEENIKVDNKDANNKTKRTSVNSKRKSLTLLDKRKTIGQMKLKKNSGSARKDTKRRTNIEHRCDCGQLFSSAALLSRHTVLAHTPPRVRRPRSSPPPDLGTQTDNKFAVKLKTSINRISKKFKNENEVAKNAKNSTQTENTNKVSNFIVRNKNGVSGTISATTKGSKINLSNSSRTSSKRTLTIRSKSNVNKDNIVIPTCHVTKESNGNLDVGPESNTNLKKTPTVQQKSKINSYNYVVSTNTKESKFNFDETPETSASSKKTPTMRRKSKVNNDRDVLSTNTKESKRNFDVTPETSTSSKKTPTLRRKSKVNNDNDVVSTSKKESKCYFDLPPQTSTSSKKTPTLRRRSNVNNDNYVVSTNTKESKCNVHVTPETNISSKTPTTRPKSLRKSLWQRVHYGVPLTEKMEEAL